MMNNLHIILLFVTNCFCIHQVCLHLNTLLYLHMLFLHLLHLKVNIPINHNVCRLIHATNAVGNNINMLLKCIKIHLEL